MTFEERRRLVERSYDAWSSGDFDTLFAIYHPECEWDNRRLGLPDIPPVSRGHDGMAEFHRITVAQFPELYVVAVEVVDLPGDRVLVEGRWEAPGGAPRAAVLAAVPPHGQIIEFRDGLILRVEYFPTIAEARETARAEGDAPLR